MSPSLISVRPSVVAAAVLICERHAKGCMPCWPSALAYLTGLNYVLDPELTSAIQSVQVLLPPGGSCMRDLSGLTTSFSTLTSMASLNTPTQTPTARSAFDQHSVFDCQSQYDATSQAPGQGQLMASNYLLDAVRNRSNLSRVGTPNSDLSTLSGSDMAVAIQAAVAASGQTGLSGSPSALRQNSCSALSTIPTTMGGTAGSLYHAASLSSGSLAGLTGTSPTLRLGSLGSDTNLVSAMSGLALASSPQCLPPINVMTTMPLLAAGKQGSGMLSTGSLLGLSGGATGLTGVSEALAALPTTFGDLGGVTAAMAAPVSSTSQVLMPGTPDSVPDFSHVHVRTL